MVKSTPKKAVKSAVKEAKELNERTKARAAKRSSAKEMNAKLKAEDDAKSAAQVGPVSGTLEATPDAVKVPEAKKKPKGQGGASVGAALDEMFGNIEKLLVDTCEAKKQPRQLRWAIKSLEAAKDAAMRHVKHNLNS